MAGISADDRDIHLRAVIKSNLVCGDILYIDKMADDILSDIIDVLSNFSLLQKLDAVS